MTEEKWSTLDELLVPHGPYYVFVAADGKRGTYFVGATNDVVKFVLDRNDYLEPGQKDFVAVYQEEVSRDDFELAEKRRNELSQCSKDVIYALVEKGNPNWIDIGRRR